MKSYTRIDKDGYAVFKNPELPFNQRPLDLLHLADDDEAPNNYILSHTNEKLWWPKWTGIEWIEGMTQEEIDELNNQPQVPTQEERIDMLENIILMIMEG